jgi:hypothetical protein
VVGTCDGSKCLTGSVEDREKQADKDGDTISDFYDRCDHKTLPDATKPDCENLDSDGDTIPDKVEAHNGGDLLEMPYSTNGVIYNFMNTDSDNNGISDNAEACPGIVPDAERVSACGIVDGAFTAPYDRDNDTIPDYMTTDNDGDGMEDLTEIEGPANSAGVKMRLCDGSPCPAGTVDAPWDSDNDTIPDYLDFDSDGDTIPDFVEGSGDSDNDGVMNRYDLDSDGDTILDKDEVVKVDGDKIVQANYMGVVIKIDGKLLVKDSGDHYFLYDPETKAVTEPADSSQIPAETFSQILSIDSTKCFESTDCDRDSLKDQNEVYCDGYGWSGASSDIDQDTHGDAAEYATAIYAMNNGRTLKNGKKTKSGSDRITDPREMICDPNINVEDIFDYYFELPPLTDVPSKPLHFDPEVSQLDVVFNVDTTASMDSAINSVKTNISNIISTVRSMVSSSGFALTVFDDFPLNNYGYSYYGDLPFRLLGTVSTDSATVTRYTQDPLFTTRAGADWAESGIESLYQIATGAGVSWSGSSVPAHTPASGRWGYVDFRNGSLPIVIHVTDAYSHDNTVQPYDTSSVPSPHYTPQTLPVLIQRGIRVITLNVGDRTGDRYGQMTEWSTQTNAIVPACAFNNDKNESPCNGKCCVGETVEPTTIDGKTNQCILKYEGAQDRVHEFISQGIDALVKYGTYEVATSVIGEPLPGDITTACFIKQVKAVEYTAPTQEPEHSCNPVAQKASITVAGKTPDYENGFKNFAPGTSRVGVKGASLEFEVVAKNEKDDGTACVEATEEAQVFQAWIDVVNPVTGLSFGRRPVSIMVPPKSTEGDN